MLQNVILPTCNSKGPAAQLVKRGAANQWEARTGPLNSGIFYHLKRANKMGVLGGWTGPDLLMHKWILEGTTVSFVVCCPGVSAKYRSTN